jgi:hypothetical protein
MISVRLKVSGVYDLKSSEGWKRFAIPKRFFHELRPGFRESGGGKRERKTWFNLTSWQR